MRIATIATGQNLQRLIYLAICGLICTYIGVLGISILIGSWLFDENGRPLATDFIAFWGLASLSCKAMPPMPIIGTCTRASRPLKAVLPSTAIFHGSILRLS
ncbi:hypothetical protein NKL05_08665 [Mesorhizobium sp. C420B]|uniref:hypothetical protein n=1 Tax=Mesorhizobium sp. C420B TaxID=2956835 RepID=UPI0033372A57